jgi:murein DD-endopeptidase MepM/ murein hydrolase activator NlpD
MSVYAPSPGTRTVEPLTAPSKVYLGEKTGDSAEFAGDGGQIQFEWYRSYRKITLIARNRYAAPVVARWTVPTHENLDSERPMEGIAMLPAAPTPFGFGPNVLLLQLRWIDTSLAYRVQTKMDFSFGDPGAEPAAYAYRLPYPVGLSFRVGQGFHGALTHTGPNEFAIDFDCPEGTPVLAMRPGVVMDTNSIAVYGGMTSYYLDQKQGNFALVLHDDGTIARYLHLAHGGVAVKPGQRVARGERLGSSGRTGFASGPHLHVDISTSAPEGNFRTFPFRFAIAPDRDEEPVEGKQYSAWESH